MVTREKMCLSLVLGIVHTPLCLTSNLWVSKRIGQPSRVCSSIQNEHEADPAMTTFFPETTGTSFSLPATSSLHHRVIAILSSHLLVFQRICWYLQHPTLIWCAKFKQLVLFRYCFGPLLTAPCHQTLMN